MEQRLPLPGIACFFVITLATEAVDAAPDKIAYELQERCGRNVAEWFNREYGNGVEKTKDGKTLTNYRSHYNSRLNKCFMLTMSTELPLSEEGR
jgi:hypothetical protein